MQGKTIQVPAHTTADTPIMIGEAGTIHIEIGDGARAVIIEQLGKIQDRRSKIDKEAVHEVDVVLGKGASLEYVSINTSEQPITVAHRSEVGEGARITWRNATLATAAVEHSLQSRLAAADSMSSVEWMFYAKGDEQYRLKARNVFDGRHGGGEMTMRGVAEERGHVRCDGLIDIGLGGGQTDTYLTQEVLMLDPTAKVDAIPGLEIKTNDVKASHSATVSRVTGEDLFYFASRGIGEREARRMFVMGFLGDMASKITWDAARQQLLLAIAAKYA
jgi:Fe-S cluster assembly scaffold protein SufB